MATPDTPAEAPAEAPALPDLIGKGEAAAILGVGERTVDRYRAERKLTSWWSSPPGRTGIRVLVSRAEVEALLAEAMQPVQIPGPTWTGVRQRD